MNSDGMISCLHVMLCDAFCHTVVRAFVLYFTLVHMLVTIVVYYFFPERSTISIHFFGIPLPVRYSTTAFACLP